MAKRAARPLAFPLMLLVLGLVFYGLHAQRDPRPHVQPPAGSRSALAARLTGRVVRVADGDTLTLLDGARVEHRIRLYGIDAPEQHQPFGARAKQALSTKVYGKTVEAENMSIDRYGRIVSKVYLDGRLINRELVAEGWAWDYVQFDPKQEFAAAQAEARTARRGVWSDSHPTPPWEFRRAERMGRGHGGTVYHEGQDRRFPRDSRGTAAERRPYGDRHY